jgi:hypothetical protein
MAKLTPSRAAQTVLCSEFTFEFADTMKDVNGVTKDFKTVGSTVVDAINLPPRAIVVGGEVVTETAVTGSTAYNVSVGDSGSATRYLGVTNRLSAGRTPLVPTGYVGDGENLRLTVSPTVADATAGKVTVRVQYIMRDRWSETVTN